ncbi:MAG TPA: RdgB/HAM1 family non-canonical purine NTP pyrophosphatase [Sporichthyaceae bacterium]
MNRIVLATRNAAKLAELARILAEADLPLQVCGVDAFADVPEVAETGTTFAENALLKAHAVAQASGVPAIADDSGLCVDALNGMPGIFSARWAGKHGDDEANLDLVLGQLQDVPDERRGAKFACAAALALPDGTGQSVLATITGVLLRERRGSNGFGYDPIFQPYGHERTTAEMSAAEKDAISHRGQALRQLLPALRRLIV